jgi:hypothetical protein
VLALAARPARAQDDPVPCPTCVWLVVTPAQLGSLPDRLNGLQVLIAAAPGADEALARHVERIREAGGKPGIMLEVSDVRGGQPDGLAFETKTRLTELRAVHPGVPLTIVAPDAVLKALAARDIGAYVDFSGMDRGRLPRALAATRPATDRPDIWRLPADRESARILLTDLAAAASWLPPTLIPGAVARVRCGEREARMFTDPSALVAIALAEACPPATPIEAMPLATTERLALATGEALVRLAVAERRFADDVRVRGARRLSVDEIIARHQAWAARQRADVRTLISSGRMTLTFEAPGFPAPVAIGSRLVIFRDEARTELQQLEVTVNGIAFRGGAVPRLPIIEPERVASPPLTITLGDLYDYAAAGEETIDATRCYVVSFEPRARDAPLFTGRAWIAADSFALVRVAAVQTGLRGPIVSSEQIDTFEPQAGRWLPSRSEVRQRYEGAGHRTPIHRVMTFEQHEVNLPEFTARRAAAYASPSVMLRDTAQGYRYLVRPPADAAPTDAPSEPSLAPAAARVRTLAAGVIVDPNITRPLPFAGLSYVDFDLFGTGTQFTAFFGGTYGQVALLVPSVGGSRWQLAARAFGIATSYNDRAFIGGREMYPENIRQRPAHASVAVLRPVTPTLTLRIGYDFDYTHFSPADVTDAEFLVPADQLAHTVRAAVEVQRRGWHGTGWWAGSARTGWREWGFHPDAGQSRTGAFTAGHRDYQRYGITLARPFVLSPRLVARVEGALMDGRDLDRFSRYSFGTFDNRLRGYPSALIRYNRGGALRLATAWSAGRALRVDGFLDTAYVHDPGFGDGLKRYSGVGAALEAPGPFGTLLAVEWGYGFQGVRSDGGRGTQVVRVTAYRIF